MKIAYKYCATILVSLALGWSCPQSFCRGAEQTPANEIERIRSLRAEDPGLLPMEQAGSLPGRILTEATGAGLSVISNSRVTSLTNGSFAKLRQTLAVEGTEAQLEDFLRNLAATNSPLRVQSLALRPTPDRSRLSVSVVIAGDYRLAAAGQPEEPQAAHIEYRVLSERRLLREAALDCYSVTKSALPAGWQLESLSFQNAKRLSAQGVAPANQVRLLEDIRAKIEKAQGRDGSNLFVPASGEATMRMNVSGLTNFSWSMQFELRPAESR